ncbi:MAG TPA: cyanophycinase [Lentisphaeria bacterium]|nr:MAG: cyanophycinase [Lentisphaerae bacterium GWF2_38_69]HBM15092.1 cyanophycinase [Lentisphaeria bacterium]
MTRGRGRLIAIGGNEDKIDNLKVLKRVVSEAKGRDTIVEVITTASENPRQMEDNYERAFKRIGVSGFGAIHIASRYDAADRSLEERINEADLIFFTGGDQLRLSSILGGSYFMEVLRSRFLEGALVAGTSAGAAALSETMIYDGEGSTGMLKGSISMGPGLAFLNGVIIDTHFINRSRIARLFQVVATNPSVLGVGLSEDTAIFIKDDEDSFEVIGSSLAVVVDGGHLKNSNISKIAKGEPIAVENFHVHTLVEGYKYNFGERKFL